MSALHPNAGKPPPAEQLVIQRCAFVCFVFLFCFASCLCSGSVEAALAVRCRCSHGNVVTGAFSGSIRRNQVRDQNVAYRPNRILCIIGLRRPFIVVSYLLPALSSDQQNPLRTLPSGSSPSPGRPRVSWTWHTAPSPVLFLA